MRYEVWIDGWREKVDERMGGGGRRGPWRGFGVGSWMRHEVYVV